MLCFMGHTLMENRNDLVMKADLPHANRHGERKAALNMIHSQAPGSVRQLKLGADKGYGSADFVAALRQVWVTPHVARKARHSAIEDRATPLWLRRLPEFPKEDRGAVWLGQYR